MLSFSTCWNNARHTDGEEMIDEILELGFDTLELSHGMTVAKLPGIHADARDKTIALSADPSKVHLFKNGESLRDA